MPENRSHKEEEHAGKNDAECLGARENAGRAFPRAIKSRKEKRKDGHAIAVANKGVIALAHFFRIMEIRILIAMLERSRESESPPVRFERVNAEDREQSQYENPAPHGRPRLRELVHRLVFA